MTAPADVALPTLFTAFGPVEEYRRWRTGAGIAGEAVSLAALDAFLMGRVAAYAPAPLCVLDLAADATSGDSVAMWAATGVPVVAPRLMWPEFGPDAKAWRAAFPLWMHDRPPGPAGDRVTLLDVTVDADDADDSDGWAAVAASLPAGRPVLVSLAAPPAAAASLATYLDALLRRLPTAWVLLLPLGETGAGPVLAHALATCPPGGSRRLHALRELAPFFAASEVALIAPAADPASGASLDRIRALVGGNFQFLTLVQEAVSTASREAVRAAKNDETDITAQAEAERTLRATIAAQAEAERVLREINHTLQVAVDELHATLDEKNVYAQTLEQRLAYLEETYLPWKNEVLTGLEQELRNIAHSKAFRAERFVRRALRR